MRKALIMIIAVSLLMAVGCKQKQSASIPTEPKIDSNKPAATVNGQVITEKTLQSVLTERAGQHTAQGANVNPESLREAVLDQLITDELVYQGAKEAGIQANIKKVMEEVARSKAHQGDEAFAAELKKRGMTQEVFVDLLLRRELKNIFVATVISNSTIPDDELKEFYKSNPMPFLMPESLKVRFIQTESEQLANDIFRKINDKGSFDAVADNLVDKQAYASNYGWTTTGLYGPTISKAMKELKTGTYGGPYKSSNLYFIINVAERKVERPKTFDEAKNEIRSMLRKNRTNADLAHWAARKRTESKIIIH